MCGIFALLNNRESNIEAIKTEFMKTKNRGPENSQFLNLTTINNTSLLISSENYSHILIKVKSRNHLINFFQILL